MTTKPGITIQPLDLDDLDQVVGGRGTMGGVLPEPHAHEADSAFMASLHGAAAVAASGSPLGDDVARPDAPHPHGAASVAIGLAISHDHASSVQLCTDAEHPAHPARHSDDPAAVRRLLGPDAAHDLHVACERVAATGMPLKLFHPAHDAVQDGFGSPPTTWEGDFARHLAGGIDAVRSAALPPMTEEASGWETHLLRELPTAQEALEATAPHFLSENQTLFEDRRERIAALFAAAQPIGAPQTR